MSGAERPASTPTNIVLFRVDEMRCGLDTAAVLEILPALAVRPVPGQPSFIAGVIDLRGTTVPILDLRVRFGRPPQAMRLSDRLIVARAHDRPLAIWVDTVEDLTICEPDGWRPAGGLVVGDRSLAGIATTASGLTAIHDLDAFISECELDALARATAS